jgi:hypothetical protein
MKRYGRVTVLVCCVALVLLLLTGTGGGLTQFSPSTLEYTTQSEFTLFGGRFPVFRSTPQGADNELVAFLREEGFVTPAPTEDQRWELISHWNDAWRDGFGPLYDVFVRYRREIIQWSKADRERARIYWTEGFKYLRSGRKVDVWAGRDILRFCWRCQSIPELREQMLAVRKEVAELFEADPGLGSR